MDKKAKKILYIITKSVWAGAGKYTYDLAVNLPKKEYEAFVAAGDHQLMAQKIMRAGLHYFEIRGFQRNVNPLKDIWAFFEILFLIFKIKPEIVHVSSAKAGGITGVAMLFYKLFLRLRVDSQKPKAIFTAHGWTFNEKRPAWQIFFIKIFSKITCLFYNKIICVSEHDKQIAIKNKIASTQKLITIHNGIKIESYNFLNKEPARAKLGLSKNDFIVGTIGEYTANKGHKYLISVSKKFPVIKFAILGFGQEKNKYEKTENVILIENVFNGAEYLRAFDIFILPSLKEGLPYVILEAGLAGLPVIATNVGGIPEIISDQKEGLLIPPANEENMAEAINQLINNKEKLEEISSNLNKKVREEFSLTKMLTRTLALYEK